MLPRVALLPEQDLEQENVPGPGCGGRRLLEVLAPSMTSLVMVTHPNSHGKSIILEWQRELPVSEQA